MDTEQFRWYARVQYARVHFTCCERCLVSQSGLPAQATQGTTPPCNYVLGRDHCRNSLCAASHWLHSQPRLSTVNMTLPAFAAERRCLLSIDISCPQQTRRMPLLLSIELTNGRTLDRFIHLSLRTIGPTTKSVVALHAELRTVYI